MKVAEVEKTIVSYCVQKLIPNAQYIFRVVAENPIGTSEPKESDPVTIRMKIGKFTKMAYQRKHFNICVDEMAITQSIFVVLDVPSAPRPPMEVSGLTKDSFILSWTESEKDGGSRIIEYEVHIKDAIDAKWKHIGRTDGNQTYIQVNKLDKKKKYWFKISARNDAGLSLPLLSDEPITLTKRISKYIQ